MADRRRAPYSSKHSTSSRGASSSRGTSSSRSTSRGRTASTSRSGNARNSGTRTNATTNRANPYKPSSKSITNAILIVFILILVIVGVGAGLLYTNIKYLYDETTIIPGVSISGIDVGGMTREQAFNELNQELNSRINALNLTLNFNGQTWTYDSNNIQTSGDITSALDAVMVYGHVGTVKERMAEAEYVLQNEEPLNIVFGYDEASVRQIITTLADEINLDPIEPSLEFDDTAGKITNVDDTVALRYNPLWYDNEVSINGSTVPVTLDANGNPTIENNIFSYTDGKDGYYVDIEATTMAAMVDLSDDFIANVDVVTVTTSPDLTKNDLKEFTSLVYHSKSYLPGSSTTERDNNIATALEAFDGLVLQPGDIVSFNETTGERTAANGYQEAPVIAQDKSVETGFGGGVCQAATIIFNAALMSGCQIIERNSHSWPSYYSPRDYGEEARDAMVNWGTSDVIFKNTTDYPIYFDTYMHWRNSEDATWGYCNVYTKLLPDGQYYEAQSHKIKDEAPAEIRYEALTDLTLYADKTWTMDDELGLLVYKHNKPKNEKIYEVYRYIMDATGQEVYKEKMYTAHYKAIQGHYYTKPADAAAPADSGDSTT